MEKHFLACALILISFSPVIVAAITNGELYEILKDNLEDVEEYGLSDNDDAMPSNDDDTLVFPGDADDEVDMENFMEQLALSNIPDTLGSDYPLVGRACSCHHDSCHCCVGKTWKIRIIFKKIKARLHACITVDYLPRDFGFRVTFTVNGRRLFHREVSLKHPPSLCYNIPGLGRFARVCLQIYKVDLRRKRLCTRLVGVLNLVFKKFRIRIKLACFRIPVMGDDWLKMVKQEAEPYGNEMESTEDPTTVAQMIDLFRHLLKDEIYDAPLEDGSHEQI